ncbi:hypothetical protein [Streptomyces sp. NPDC058291]|uniref:hypothetical protein n=1 Tax=Streptomyces sp. NPDC058291 TaxID=3346427 RepID=UPI0036E1665E
MTTPPPRLSPTAGLLNAAARLYIRRARNVIAAQERELDEARNLNHALRAARDYRASQQAGYIDRTGLET